MSSRLHAINSQLLWSQLHQMPCQKGSRPRFLPIVRAVVGCSRTMQVTPSRPTWHTHSCTRKRTQSARSDLSAWPVCTMSKEVFWSYQSSMNTDREGNLRGERVKRMFPPMCTNGLCFLNTGGHSLRDRTDGETRYSACNFSVHTCLQADKAFQTESMLHCSKMKVKQELDNEIIVFVLHVHQS